MAPSIIDYTFDQAQVSNPDGSLPIDIDSAAITSLEPEPVIVDGVAYNGALDTTGLVGGLSVDIGSISTIDPVRFHARVVFYFEDALNGKQNLIECDRLPFVLALDGDGGTSTITASVKSRTIGWRSSETYSSPDVVRFEWHYADLVYDTDTVAVFLDGKFVSLHGFGSENSIELLSNGSFTVAGTDDTVAFEGLLAAVKFDAGIPSDLESMLDIQRVSAQWFITTKLESLRPSFDMGNPLSAPAVGSTGFVWTQEYDRGLIIFSSSAGSAFEIHGSVFQRYIRIEEATPGILGYLVSDTIPTNDPLDPTSVVATFSQGAIYYSPQSSGRLGAVEVVGRIYVNYMISGGPQVTGIPLIVPVATSGGILQIMSRASWFWKVGASAAFFVQGAIRDAYQISGGWITWGFPLSNEVDV